MKTKILIAVLMASLAFPTFSHAFGLLRYIFDGVSNQLGLDRGPIPKVAQPPTPPPFQGHQQPENRNPDAYKVYIQAEGF